MTPNRIKIKSSKYFHCDDCQEQYSIKELKTNEFDDGDYCDNCNNEAIYHYTRKNRDTKY